MYQTILESKSLKREVKRSTIKDCTICMSSPSTYTDFQNLIALFSFSLYSIDKQEFVQFFQQLFFHFCYQINALSVARGDGRSPTQKLLRNVGKRKMQKNQLKVFQIELLMEINFPTYFPTFIQQLFILHLSIS